MGAYLYGDLSPEEMREVRLHTQVCDRCRVDLEERGRVVASLGDAVPELTDQEKARIAWTVKGALRDNVAPRTGFRLKWGSALAAAVLAVAGLAVGAHVLIRQPSPPTAPEPRVDRELSRAVTVEEVPTKPKSETGKSIAASETGNSTPVVKRRRSTRFGDNAARFVRDNVPGTVASRSDEDSNRKKTVVPDAPAPVVDAPSPQPKENGSVDVLPKPVDLNNAQTTHDTQQ